MNKAMMKKTLFSLLLLFAATAVSAQGILKGDMNDDEHVTIADVTSLVNVVLGKAPQEKINVAGDPYKVDNSFVVGKWVAPDNSSFALNEDGTTTFPDAATYKFRPVQGVLTFYDANNNPIKAIVLNEVTSDYLMAVDYASNIFTKYTRQGEYPENPDSHEYVDLGLPSGTLWATCNIGANSPEEYGDYFAWGETEGYNDGKTNFDWSTYKWCEGSDNTMTKYCTDSSYGYNGFTDDKTELDLEDDAAYVNWGPDWRMPSDEQFLELINISYTTTEWTTQNGVNGCKITSKTNGNSIFLPAVGYRSDSSLHYAGSGGGYWSRALYSDSPNDAGCLSLLSSDIIGYDDDGYRYGYRCGGLSVRPVRSQE